MFIKLPEVNNDPICEISPNLVTLFSLLEDLLIKVVPYGLFTETKIFVLHTTAPDTVRIDSNLVGRCCT
jgi:hypothetical protein